MKILSALKGWKTRVTSALVIIVGAASAIDPSLLHAVLGDRGAAYFIIATGVAMFILRQVTTTPPGRSS